MKAVLAIALTCSCGAARTGDHAPLSGQRPQPVTVLGDVRTARVEANWKERLEQPYVYFEKRGDYRDLGQALEQLLAEVRSLDLLGAGAPFALFIDDPGKVPLGALRARVCYPVADRPVRMGDLEYDLLPRAMVVYARIRGTRPAATHVYPALFGYLRELGWQTGGPVREVYQVSSDEARSGMLEIEVQIPWAARAEPTDG